jgi:hypothetical protein
MKRPAWTIQHVQLELADCGKSNCRKCKNGPSHGPYWHGYNWQGIFDRSCYIGKHLPEDLRHLAHGNEWKPPVAKPRPPELVDQVVLEDVIPDAYDGLLEVTLIRWGLPLSAARDQVRKKVWNMLDTKKRTPEEKNGIWERFVWICRQQGWSEPTRPQPKGH